MFIWQKGDLNKEQEDAILENESLLLIACPGSGKTRTLTYKIAYELSRLKSEKEYIIAITYTNKAADEIKERVEILGVDIKQLWIGTMHAFCLEWILRPYSQYLNELKNGYKILNSHDSEILFTELCKPYKNPKITHWDLGYYATTTGYHLSCLDTNKKESLEQILSDYHHHLSENHQIDFEQILHYSYKLLKENSIINSILSNIFPFILIDEYQDTKEIQYHIVSSILKAGKGTSKTLIVGDPNQSIYETMGGFPMAKAELEGLLGFELKDEYTLSSNYRSSSRIVKYFDHFKTYENQIVPEWEFKEYESIISYNNILAKSELMSEIARLIILNIEGYNISSNEICIAAPQWVHLASLTRGLMIKLPDISFDGPGMAPFSRDIDNFWYKISRIVLTEPSPNLYIRRLRWANEVLNELFAAGVDTSNITNKSFLKFCNSITLEEEDGLKYLILFFAKICDYIKIDLKTFPSLEDHYKSFFESSKARIARLKKEGSDTIGSIVNFRKVFKQRDGVRISTIHGTKGTEFDTIIGFGLLDSWVPHFSDKKNGSVNSKKMLYVLCSRARKNLHLISEKGRNVNYYNPDGLMPTPHLIEYTYKYDRK
jgi:DNA helicase-2/ATP-dependent DNA helicase PcrA